MQCGFTPYLADCFRGHHLGFHLMWNGSSMVYSLTVEPPDVTQSMESILRCDQWKRAVAASRFAFSFSRRSKRHDGTHIKDSAHQGSLEGAMKPLHHSIGLRMVRSGMDSFRA
ncbi:uncharacterized protein LOC143363648 [Halictus rubicundus]|uniref:uncharacterized protein LOC143363648 n=1 Tax=Halictus rubicundus TaxID=77578 RepID=UPI004036A775